MSVISARLAMEYLAQRLNGQGNLVMMQAKVTTDVYQQNLGGYDTRLWIQVVLPVWTPRAPEPRNAR